jgi:D-alanyl-D-alanine carboxypeptidase/D-alanyl-D-alanine-endopeptidase (penicillin-binding protein 4)
VGDETYFRADILGDGWLWNDVQWYFGAEISALSVNGNEIALNAAPGQSNLTPPTDYVRVTNTLKRGGVARLGLNRGLSDNQIRVWGETPPGQGARARLAVHNPALWAAQIFRNELKMRGITVDGEAQATDALIADDAQRFQPEKAVELAAVQSATLGEIVRETNKQSLNLNAELLLRTLGKLKGSAAPPPAPDKLDEHHDDKRGLAVLKMWLKQKGIDAENLSLHDGSGLSRLALVTPEASARALAAIAKTPAAEVFRASLPVAGRDGTLAGRLKSLSGQVFAKTGTLTHANALAGYATAANGEPLAFAIICNDEAAPGSSSVVIDEIVRLLATF